ncbi:MAG: arginine--tRNA ligase, partial [Ignavibacteria bacterium]|nr:arginine--tRNA ligase [Ignavibacteria bacterium]
MKNYLISLFNETSLKLPYLKDIQIIFDRPKVETHGDISSNAAMLLTKILKKNPREIANEIIANLPIDDAKITKVEIAGPGFINFFFHPDFLVHKIKNILAEQDEFGKSKKHSGKRANVEFVSANPTGPLTVGHGRNAVCGDTLANLLEWTGYEVDREYYFNNAGRQMRVLGDSVRLRYLELLGDVIEFPEDYYQGDYIKSIAESLKSEFGDLLRNESAEGKFKEKAEKEIFLDIEKTLQRLNIKHKNFFNENSLYEEKKIENLLKT